MACHCAAREATPADERFAVFVRTGEAVASALALAFNGKSVGKSGARCSPGRLVGQVADKAAAPAASDKVDPLPRDG